METKTVEAVVSVGRRYAGRVPTFEVEPAWWSEVEGVTRQLDQLLGVRTMVLRLVNADEAVVGRGGRVVYHVQALGDRGRGQPVGRRTSRPCCGGGRARRAGTAARGPGG